MNIVDRIRVLSNEHHRVNYAPPVYVYLGYNEMSELGAIETAYRTSAISATQIHGLEVVPVSKQSHLAVGN